ncbi:MAG: hypothetical protein WC627_13130 [Legionella sp.]|jgi:hypothetical protein
MKVSNLAEAKKALLNGTESLTLVGIESRDLLKDLQNVPNNEWTEFLNLVKQSPKLKQLNIIGFYLGMIGTAYLQSTLSGCSNLEHIGLIDCSVIAYDQSSPELELNKLVESSTSLKSILVSNVVHHLSVEERDGRLISSEQDTFDTIEVHKNSSNTTKSETLLDGTRATIISNLDKYIKKIENYVNPESNIIDFSHGFILFAKSRAINREANYFLAKRLKTELELTNIPINEILNTTHATLLRLQEIENKALANKEGYVYRMFSGSTDLKKIIDEGQVSSKSNHPNK